MADLNPAFTFDFGGGGDRDNVAQAPWEFAGALAQTEKDGPGASKATSIDHKIAQMLARNKRPAAAGKKAPPAKAVKGRQPAPSKAAAAAAGAAASSDDDDDEGYSGSSSGSEDEEDAPLPGEVDEDDDESAGSDYELAGADLALDDDSEDEEEEAEEEEEQEELEEESGSEDELAKAGMELDSDELASSSEDEEQEEEEEEQQVVAAAGKRKREQQPAAAAAVAAAGTKQQQQQAQKQQKQAQQQARRGAAGAADSDDEAQQRQQEQAAKRQKGADRKATKGGFYDATPKDTKFVAQSFADLHLSRPLTKACQALGYNHPTPIQAACIPLALAGRDICGSAITGSGKTAAFGLPLLERLLHRNKRVAAIYVLVLTPVRELAVQVHSMIQKLGQFTDIQTALVVGGLSLQSQAAALRSQPEIVVATPGRLIDHLRNTQSVGLEDLAVLVLDEADRLLEMGFAEEIREVVKMAPVRRQTMLFSATMTEEVQKLVQLSLKHPVRLAADAAAAAPKELTQEIVRLKGAAAAQKEAALLALCSRSFKTGRTIIFAKTKARAHRLKMLFGLAGLPAAGELHGDMTQAARLESLERFRKGEVAYLLATDVAARGLDILGVEAVVNYDCPAQFSSYLHRVGRTARAGVKGRAVTFIEDDDRGLLKEVIKRTGVQMQQRQVLQAAVDSWQHRIEKLEPQVKAIFYEEREERALRKAEMEAQKASNMLEHEEQIFSRPPRTWFQTEKQKKELAEKSKQAAADGDAGGGSGDEGDDDNMTTQQKRNKAKNERRLEQKQQRAKEATAASKKKSNKLMDETAASSRTIKAVKAREQALRMEGMSGAKAGKVAASLVTGVKKRKKKSKGKGGDGGGGGELFDGDGLSKPGAADKSGAKVYSGGARSGKVKPPRAGGLGKTELNRAKRGGKGKATFKSKAKHKRR